MRSSRAVDAVPLVRSLPVCLFIVIVLLTAPAWYVPPTAEATPAAQKLKPTDHYALIFGTVWGPDDHPVYGVKVYIREAPHKKHKWELHSDHAGEFAQRVPAVKSDYLVGADLRGVKTTSGRQLLLAEEVPVHVEYDERVDIGLHLTLKQ